MRHRRFVAAVGFGLLAACTAAVSYVPPDAASTASAATERVDWNQAIALLRSGRVLAVTQLHDLSVTLSTQDGKRYVTKEPTIDAILGAITLHAPNAQAIVIATE